MKRGFASLIAARWLLLSFFGNTLTSDLLNFTGLGVFQVKGKIRVRQGPLCIRCSHPIVCSIVSDHLHCQRILFKSVIWNKRLTRTKVSRYRSK